MITFLTVIHVLVCLFLILVVLLQAGKGGGMGIAFGGGGGSQTVFGSSGAGNFLTRLTSITAFIFLITSLALAHYSSQQDSRRLQRLAEQKAAQKKDEDARAAKLKQDLDKARQDIQKTAGATAPAAATQPASAGEPATPPAGETKGKKADTKADTKAGASAAKTTDKAEKPVAAPRRKKAPAPAADGTTAPVESPPAKAPAAE